MLYKQFRIAARGLVVQQDKLLFVSDDGHYWYLPGGCLEKGESLQSCVARELYEETGLTVTVGQLCYVQEHLDSQDETHKIHFFFQANLKEGSGLKTDWSDEGGAVKFRRFFSLAEMEKNKNIVPHFLTLVPWQHSSSVSVYQGLVRVRGFEIVDELQESHRVALSQPSEMSTGP